jgi:hypothetical protein
VLEDTWFGLSQHRRTQDRFAQAFAGSNPSPFFRGLDASLEEVYITQ